MNKSKLFTLIKYFLSIDFFVFTSIGQNFKKKSKKSHSFQGIISLLVYFFLFASVIPKFSGSLANIFLSNEGSYYLTTIIISIFVVTLFFSLAQSFIFIEKNNESEFLLTLPISGETIIKSRVYSLSITFLLSFYLMIIYLFILVGIKLSLPIYYYIFTVISLVILNIFTVVLSGIIILIFGQMIKKSKFFNRFAKGLYGFFVIFLFLIYMFFVQTISNPSITISANQLISKIENTFSKVFFFIIWVKNIILGNSIKSNFINLFIGIIILSITIFIFNILAKTNYLKILRSANLVTKDSDVTIAKRKKVGFVNNKQSKWIVIFKKELRDIVSNPTYILQVVMFDLIILIFSGIGIYFAFTNKILINQTINNFISFISFNDLLLYSFAIGGVLGLFAGLGSMTVSSISREGKSFWVVATAPIKISTQLIARVFGCQFIHIVSYIIVILASTLIYVFNPIIYILLILGIIFTLFVSGLINMILGLLNPYFDWKTPKEAINGGSGTLNTFLSVLINYGIYALIVFTFVFGIKKDISLHLISIICILIVLILGIIAYIIDYKLFKRILKRL